MKLYFDENFSPHLVKGLASFQEGRPNEDIEVAYLCDVFGRGCKDEEWIPQVGKEECVVLTQDINIHRSKALCALYQAYNVSFFFVRSPKKKGYAYWDWIREMMKHWAVIKEISVKRKRPFGYMISPRDKEPQKL